MTLGAFQREWLRRAVRGALLAIGFKGRVETVRTVLLWAVSVLILYAVDWHRVPIIGTDNPGASSEVRLALCVLGGMVGTFVFAFVWQIVVQPAEMDDERRAELLRQSHASEVLDAERRAELVRQSQASEVLDAERRAEIKRLSKIIADLRDGEALLKRLSDMHSRGHELYHRQADTPTWSERMAEWNAEVEAFLGVNFSVSALHQYRKPGHGSHITTTWQWPDGEDDRLTARYTGRLLALDSIIRLGTPVSMARLRLGEARIETVAKQ